ncbi:B3 domain-containing protein-like protein [Salvia divinorum]|uniref:B3 domain-containing protein-like protein n=1 Tax=Salvia divinorum TaxID=28513 RepID=A0ABD1FW43_SALDI
MIHSQNLAEEVVQLECVSTDNLPEFFKIYMPALSSKLLRIPPDFVDKFGEDIPARCRITERRGGDMSWEVDMKKVNDCWFLEKGWPNFAQDNLLRDGDFLTFCYVAKSLFHVQIFSPNGCAKRENSGIYNETKPEADINGNPSFSCVITKRNLKRDLCLPITFWKGKAHMMNMKRMEVTLWVENKAWNVGMVRYGYGIRFQKGMAKFWRDNSVKVGNSCTFHLIHTKHLSFMVTFD